MRPIPGFERYSITAGGEVSRKGKPLKAQPNSKGYLRVFLRKEGATHTRYVHRLVCEAYHRAPEAGEEVRHLNGNNQDNRADNLAWGNRLENAADMEAHGTRVWGAAAKHSRLRAQDVLAMREMVRSGSSMQAAAKAVGVPEGVAADAITGRRWKRLPGAVPVFTTRRQFTPAEVREIRQLRGKESEVSIAKRLGVARNTVNQIMRRVSYDWVS